MKFSVTWDPVGVTISECYFSYNYYYFPTQRFLNVPVAVVTKVAQRRNFEISFF